MDVTAMSPDECVGLLGRDSVGRVAFVTPAGPRLTPVTYVSDASSVTFRTTAYSELATYAPETEVSFEIDHLDRDHRRGWSVVAHGTCERVEDEAQRRRALDPVELQPWAGGVRPVVLRVRWREIAGRKVGGASSGRGAMGDLSP
ncbi:MAG: pyridoxamine 5'-phosphate oxidase family protein [Nocardioides sp.]|uniref:pyridoxamine 5'-phosphate oxidase family protein n=1 Tax=Nocardioides sp. TaxID=35761 RepID=UPI003F0E3975